MSRLNLQEAIIRHGQGLLKEFPEATEQDPVKLCKKLRRIENAVARPILDYTNGDNGITTDQLDEITDKSKEQVRTLLGLTEEQSNKMGLFINRDPRGYAIKVSSEWSADKAIHRDWGGYGILAPDLTVS